MRMDLSRTRSKLKGLSWIGWPNRELGTSERNLVVRKLVYNHELTAAKWTLDSSGKVPSSHAHHRAVGC
jgi:hypothetical protein